MFSHPPDAHGTKAACGVEPLSSNLCFSDKLLATWCTLPIDEDRLSVTGFIIEQLLNADI